jgi:EpsI family protein
MQIFQSKYLRVLTIVLVLQAALFYTASHGDSRILRQPLKQFPEVVSGWQGVVDGVVEQETLDVLKADDVLSRFYIHMPMSKFVSLPKEEQQATMMRSEELFVAYFSTQQQGQSPHSPKNCLPGAGWTPVDTGEMSVPIAGLAAPIVINKYVIEKGSSQSLVLYWYQSHGRVVANEFSAKFFLVADSLRYHRSDTALVRVVTPVLHDDLAASMDSATSFVQAIFPAIYKYLPM